MKRLMHALLAVALAFAGAAWGQAPEKKKITIAVGRLRNLSARKSCMPPASAGVRESSSPRTNITGVRIFRTKVMAERLAYSCGFWNGGARNQFG